MPRIAFAKGFARGLPCKASGLISYASRDLVYQIASFRWSRVCGSESCNIFGNHLLLS